MGIITNFTDKLVEGYMRRKGINPNATNLPMLSVNDFTLSGYTPGNFVKAYGSSAELYSVGTLLIRKMSSIPMYLYEVRSDKKTKAALRRYKTITSTPIGKDAIGEVLRVRKSALDESMVVEDGDLATLLKKPNQHQNQDQFLESCFGFRVLSGEANIWGNSLNEKSRIVELQVLPTQKVEDIYSKNDVYGIEGHYLDLNTKFPIQKENLCRWKSWRPDFDAATRIHMRGISVVEVAWNNYLMGKYGATAAAKMLQNGGAKGALSPAVLGQQWTNLTKTQRDEAQQRLDEAFNGVDNTNMIRILAGPYDYLNFGLSAVDMDIVNVMKFSLHQWCRMLGVPTVLFDSEHTSDNNYQNAMRDLVTNTVMPLLASFRDRFNGWLLPRFGMENTHFIDFDISGLPELQRDMEKLVNSLSKAYWLKEDEKRGEMNFDPLGGAYDTSLVNSGMTPIEMVGMDVPMQPAGVDPNADPNVAY